VSARKQREQELFNDLALADDHLAQLRGETIPPGLQSFIDGFVGGKRRRRRGSGFE
jgi:hypothetical protein